MSGSTPIGTMTGLYSQEAGLVEGSDFSDGGAAELARRFPKGFHQAFAFLLFILLYVPCIGATAVVFKEIGKFYGAVFVVYLTVFGWAVAAMYHAAMVTRSVPFFALGAALVLGFFGVLKALAHPTINLIKGDK